MNTLLRVFLRKTVYSEIDSFIREKRAKSVTVANSYEYALKKLVEKTNIYEWSELTEQHIVKHIYEIPSLYEKITCEKAIAAMEKFYERDILLVGMKEKNPHASALGKLGGRARAQVLSAERRKEIGANAVRIRWERKKLSTSAVDAK